MNRRSQKPSHTLEIAASFFGSARFSAALTLTSIGIVLASLFLRGLMGWPGLVGALSVLVLLASLSLASQHATIEWHGLLPISLLVFATWVCISVLWSQYPLASIGSVLYFAAVTMLGIYIALVRDTFQIARAFGDVLRIALALGLALEILSGILLDMPLKLFHIAGRLAEFGPIQGLWGTRNELGIVALLALVTFGIEWRTRSVSRNVSLTCLSVALLMVLLARSPVAYGGLAVLGVATVTLIGLRRLSNLNKRNWQFGLLLATVAVCVAAWDSRVAIINALSASGELSSRLALWRQLRLLIPEHQFEGWGWIGIWHSDESAPFLQLMNLTNRNAASGLNAFLDVWFQLGLVGLFLFVVVVALAFIRSWLLASRQRSIVYSWPALMLVVLIITALAESSILIEFGWLTFVVCSVKAARELSWRKAFAETVTT